MATAAVLVGGGHVIPPCQSSLLAWSETRAHMPGEKPLPVAHVGRQVLGLTGAEATVVFSTRRTVSQLVALEPFFRDNSPITPAAVTATSREDLAFAVADWLHPAG